MRARLVCAAALGLLCLAANAVPNKGLWGTVTYVSDGDTLWVKPDGESRPPLKLRLVGIDAPERCQAHGETARRALQARLMDHRVRVLPRATDQFGRVIAQVNDGGTDVSAWLVLQGHAWSPAYRGRPGAYAEQERAARSARRGLFADAGAVPPSSFRQQHGPCGP